MPSIGIRRTVAPNGQRDFLDLDIAPPKIGGDTAVVAAPADGLDIIGDLAPEVRNLIAAVRYLDVEILPA
jgi:hypothetical protein